MAVRTETRGSILLVTIDRPESMNALNIETLKGLEKSFIDFSKDDALRVAILTGAGEKAFCAGADLKEVAALSPEERAKMVRPGGIHRSLRISKPLIAAVNGMARGGGCEMALACDIRIASETASFALTEVRLGVIPGGGGTQRITRTIPRGIAMEMLLTGRAIDAAEAYRVGLVNRVAPPGELLAAAFTVAEEIAANAPLAVRAVKEAATRGLDMTLEEGLKLESALSRVLRGTWDALEGPRAFAEKRKPRFEGR